MPIQRSVLVVDANPTERSGTVLLLESAGYRVMSAAGFDEAKQFLAVEVPDLLITDLRLGSYNGLHLVLRSRRDHPGMAALVVSRYPDPVLEAEALRQNARFLLKPLPDEDLLDAITQLLPTTVEQAEPSLGSAL
jgi:DNA-binding NtrC family response regulator